MATKKYNGWANYETWNVALWLGNDEPLYHLARDYARRHKRITASQAKEFVAEVFPNGTPDTRDMGSVRHGEIARFLNELND